MSLYAAILIIISAVIHAAWNFLGKKEHPSVAFFLIANTAGLVCLAPVLFYYRGMLPAVPLSVWRLTAATGFCMVLYFSALAGAYRTGDISMAYPLVRSSPIIIVLTAAFILGKSDQIGPWCVAGIILVMAGCFLLPVKRFRQWKVRDYYNLCCLLALLAALGTTGYTIIDDEALRRLRDLPGQPFSSLDATLLYMVLEMISTCTWLGLFVAAVPGERKNIRRLTRTVPVTGILAGIGIISAYGLVLYSMAFVTNVSYVAAFRQLSIPLGAFLGIAFLREPRPLPKLIGIGCIFTGLVMVGLG